MSIAQPEVAGEGCVHPTLVTLSISAPDSQALVEFGCDATNLTWIIFRAAFRASHIDALPARARAVLAALARTVVSTRPYAAIYSRRELLTGRAMQSMRTFYRSLDDLEAAGINGRAHPYLTEKAAVLLGLIDTKTDANSNAEILPKGQQPAQANGEAHPSTNVADGSIYKDVYPTSFQKRQPGALPSNLERLTSLGFNKFFVFKLMAEARDNGKRLSDVVESCWHSLKKAVAPIAYLRSLLHRPVDFSYQARQRQTDNDNKAQADNERTELMQTLRSAAGQTFIDPANGFFIEIGEHGTDALVRYRDESRPRSAVGSWMLDIARGIKAGQIELHDNSTRSTNLIGSHLPRHPAGQRSGEGSETNTSRTHVMQMR
ncbi:Replication protein RepA [Candidatus Paraburkholderia kirkii UZHbot1]|uniref:Replication protein RepA n=1 Tax=Candidatus Paraburkholderia kirkii UZHbot1 TaxID=1055526 RepID=G4MBN0_9BURK|nr:Replication protein RepA [Candidatus Paraburkholderia kirkii UZHbot1]